MASREWIESAARADKDPVGAGGFGSRGQQLVLGRSDAEEARRGALTLVHLATRHPCQLSKASGVTTCTHPDHARDAADALETLRAVGLAAPLPRRLHAAQTTSVSHKARGMCPVCRKTKDVRVDITMTAHNIAGRRCDGTGQRPVVEGS